MRICALTFLVFTMMAPGATPDAAIGQRITALLARMTLDEKIGQMSQSTSMATLTDSIKDEIRRGRWGSFLNAGSPADRVEAQRIARHETRLGIPLLFGRDVIHGYRTIFPIPTGQAASWDPALIEQAARIAATEATTEGIRWTFAPMVDIARDPRWGRIAESPGEDPWVAETVGAAMVRGFPIPLLWRPVSNTSQATARRKLVAITTAPGSPKSSSAMSTCRLSAPPSTPEPPPS